MASIGELRGNQNTLDGVEKAGLVRREVLHSDCDTAVIGAGPYGLAAAAHLRGAKADLCVFGGAMDYWRLNMPRGMLLRSPWAASNIADPRREFTLDHYPGASAWKRSEPLSIERFIAYGEWFQQQVAPGLDSRSLRCLEYGPEGFQLLLEDGATMRVRRVVLAAGLSGQGYRPPEFDRIAPELATHASDHCDFARFAGKRVAVIGAGQSALESAVLLSEAGAEVEVIARRPQIRWLGSAPGAAQSALRAFLYRFLKVVDPPAPLGPFPMNWAVELPTLFRMLPGSWQAGISERALRAGGSRWLLPRAGKLRFRTGQAVARARESQHGLLLQLSGGETVPVDHALLATGYRVDIARYRFLSPELIGAIHKVNGHPVLGNGFESSVPRLHFMGAAACLTYGPLMRFVAGTGYSARLLARHVAAERARL